MDEGVRRKVLRLDLERSVFHGSIWLRARKINSKSMKNSGNGLKVMPDDYASSGRDPVSSRVFFRIRIVSARLPE